MEKNTESKGMIASLPSVKAFWAGFLLATGIWFVLAFLVSFVVLLVVVLADVNVGGGNDSNRAANTNTAPAVEADAGTAVPSGTIDLDSLDWVRGEGDITVVEYSDIDCPFCQRFHDTMKQVVSDYDGEVQWAYKHFPLTSLHPFATEKAIATECAGNQNPDLFWPFLDGLFDNPSSTLDEIDVVAAEVGLDVDALNNCIDSGEFDNVVSTHASEAQQFGGQGTPYSLIIDENGEILDAIPGALPLAQVQQLLDQYVN